jgi:hypothetical protein
MVMPPATSFPFSISAGLYSSISGRPLMNGNIRKTTRFMAKKARTGFTIMI